MERLEAIIVGGGQAGLAASRYLAAAGIGHAVLERGRIGESWRSQRWDSFALNTPSWANRLPSETDDDVPQPADGFLSAPGFADHLVGYATRWGLPVREGVPVTAVAPDGEGDFTVTLGPRDATALTARSVIVASGIQNVAQVPPIASALPARVVQLPALAYRNAGSLPDGAVLVVGSGQTGAQVTEDLLDAGRRVFLSPSRVPRFPRRYRGRDIFEWLVSTGFFEATPDQLPDPALMQIRQPLASGVGRYGHTISLQSLAARGVTLVGRIRSVEHDALVLDDTVADCIRFGDAWSARMRGTIDASIEASGSPLPPVEDDPADAPHPAPDTVRSPERLDLGAQGIGTVVWATGVRGEFGWLPAGLLDTGGVPRHQAGVTALPGLFVLGFPWLTRRGSGIIHGIGGDARRLADAVIARAG